MVVSKNIKFGEFHLYMFWHSWIEAPLAVDLYHEGIVDEELSSIPSTAQTIAI